MGEFEINGRTYVFRFNPGPARVEWWEKGTRSRRHVRTIDVGEMVAIGDGQLFRGDFTKAIKAAY